MKLPKLAVVSVAVSAAIGVVAPHEFGSLYPYANVAFSAGIVAVILLAWRDPDRADRRGTYLGLIVALSVAYRIRILAFSASLLGIDADSYAIQIGRVIELGRTSAITLPFYREAPYHILVGALTGLLTGNLSLAWELVYALIVGTGVPLVAAAFVLRLRPGATATAVLAAGAVSLVGFTFWYSLAPIAQISGTVFLFFGGFTALAFIVRPRLEWFLLAFLFGLATIFSHKLTGIALAVGLLGALILVASHPSTRGTGIPRSTLLLTVVVVALVLFQQLYLTNFASVVSFKLSQMLLPGATRTETPGPPTAATNPYTTAVRAYRLSYLFVLAALSVLGFLGWLWTSVRTGRDRQGVVFLGLAAQFPLLFAVLYLSDINPIRNLLLAEAFLVVVAAIGVFWYVVERSGNWATKSGRVAAAVLLVLVASSGLSPVVSPDYRPVGRQYLTEPEVEAKLWGQTHSTARISTDQYYALATPPSRIAYIAAHGRDDEPDFVAATDVYLNRRFASARLETVAHRNCVTTLRSGYGVWRLTYDASDLLRDTYDTVYSNGCVTYHTASGATNASD